MPILIPFSYEVGADVDDDVKPGDLVIYNPSRKIWVVARKTRGSKRIKNKFYAVYAGESSSGKTLMATSGSVVVRADGPII